MKVKGIHHISSIVSHPQMNVDFNTSVLGLRMIKKAVNFDDSNTYHFYYGNDKAEIGTTITAFPMNKNIKEGLRGGGQTSSIYYIIPKGTMDFWEKRLNSFNILTSKRYRFNNTHLVFEDEAGIQNELVESNLGNINTYEYNGVSQNEAIKGFYGALIYSENYKKSKDFFESFLGMKLIDEDDNSYRFSMEQNVGKYIDLSKRDYKRGRLSKGTVHHIALTVDSLDELIYFREKVKEMGINVTDIKDRNFFKSIYFKEPGGTIIELATKEPGFSSFKIDDKATELFLPKHYEYKREMLEDVLVPVFVKETKELKVYKYETKEEYDMYYYHQNLLNRINELARISKERDLSSDELKEREELRVKYVKNIRKGFESLTSSIKIEDASGNLKNIERKDVKWNN